MFVLLKTTLALLALVPGAIGFGIVESVVPDNDSKVDPGDIDTYAGMYFVDYGSGHCFLASVSGEILQWSSSCPSGGGPPLYAPNGDYNCGKYSSTTTDDDGVRVQQFTNGDYCAAVGARRISTFHAVLDLPAGSPPALEASEPSTCIYRMVLHLPPEGIP